MKNLKNTTAIETVVYGPSNPMSPSTTKAAATSATGITLIPHGRVIEFEGESYTVSHVPSAAEEAQVVLSGNSGEIAMSVEAFGTRYLGPHIKMVDAAYATATTADKAIKKPAARPIASYSEAVQAEIQERLFAMRHVDRLSAERGAPPKEGEFAKAAVLARQECQSLNIGPANRKPASAKKLRGLHGRWIASNRDEASLAPQHQRKDPTAAENVTRLQKIMRVVIRRHYLTKERPNLSVAHEILKGMILKDVKNGKLPSQTKPPSYERFRKEMHRVVTARTWLHKREGADAAQTLRITKPGAIVAERPLQIVLVDHTAFDGFALVLVRGKFYAVRPWLTVGIDTYSRSVWSAVLSLSAPSTRTLSELLRIGSLPKRPTEWGAASEYPMHGIPEVIISDRGSEFLSKYWALTASRLGFEWRICPEASLKAIIERFFGTVASNFCSGLPGRSFASVAERGAYEAVAKAALFMQELRNEFMLWVIDFHHNRRRKSLGGRTPLEAWMDAMDDPDMQPLTVTDVDRFLIDISPVETRKITNKGVRLNGAYYTSRDAQRLLSKHGVGKDYEIRYDTVDRSRIFLLDPDEHRWLALACATPRLVGDPDFTDWLKTAKLSRETGVAEEIAAAAQLKNAEERQTIQAAQKKGTRPKTGDKASDVQKAAPPSQNPPSKASRQNARKPVAPKATPRGRNAVNF